MSRLFVPNRYIRTQSIVFIFSSKKLRIVPLFVLKYKRVNGRLDPIINKGGRSCRTCIDISFHSLHERPLFIELL